MKYSLTMAAFLYAAKAAPRADLAFAALDFVRSAISRVRGMHSRARCSSADSPADTNG